MYKELSITGHRPSPLPDLPWIMTQVWEDTAFVHWSVPREQLIQNLPPELELDSYNGQYWVGIVPFIVSEMKGRVLPRIPFFNRYNEVNIRTYVKYRGVPGVYFLALDANHPLAVLMARTVYGLPYKNAKVNFSNNKNFTLVESIRDEKSGIVGTEMSYRPVTEIFFSEPGSLEEFLTERYCLWTKRGDKLFRADIHHTKWELQQAEGAIRLNFNHPEAGLDAGLNKLEPLFHFCARKRAFFWPPLAEN